MVGSWNASIGVLAKCVQEMDEGAADNAQAVSARKRARKETTLTSSHMHSLTQAPNSLSSAALSVPPIFYPTTVPF
jgi:hypothetical protein